jgi:hypothetical protein
MESLLDRVLRLARELEEAEAELLAELEAHEAAGTFPAPHRPFV